MWHSNCLNGLFIWCDCDCDLFITSNEAVADLHSKILDVRPLSPGGPDSFNFMQFWGIFGKIVCWHRPPPRGVGAPSSGKSWIRHWWTMRFGVIVAIALYDHLHWILYNLFVVIKNRSCNRTISTGLNFPLTRTLAHKWWNPVVTFLSFIKFDNLTVAQMWKICPKFDISVMDFYFKWKWISLQMWPNAALRKSNIFCLKQQMQNEVINLRILSPFSLEVVQQNHSEHAEILQFFCKSGFDKIRRENKT